MDGDLGPYDVVEARLRAADTIILLDFSLVRCAWRTIRRLRERADFWRWLVACRWQSRPILLEAIANHAVNADLHVFRNPEALSTESWRMDYRRARATKFTHYGE